MKLIYKLLTRAGVNESLKASLMMLGFVYLIEGNLAFAQLAAKTASLGSNIAGAATVGFGSLSAVGIGYSGFKMGFQKATIHDVAGALTGAAVMGGAAGIAGAVWASMA